MRKSSTDVVSRSVANSSMSSCDSVSSSASATARLTTTRPSARLTTTRPSAARLTTTRPASDRPALVTPHGAAKLSRVKSAHLNSAAKPMPLPRRARPSLSTTQHLNTGSEVKQTSKPSAVRPPGQSVICQSAASRQATSGCKSSRFQV